MRILVALALAVVASGLVAACASTPSPPVAIDLASQVPAPVEEALRRIGPGIDGPGTAALYTPLQDSLPLSGVRVLRDQRYGPDPRRQLLDVFTPATAEATPRPVLVFVHGGDFTEGDRRLGSLPFYDNVALQAVQDGMVGVTLTYRLAPDHPWPAAQEDLAAAVSWLRAHVGALGGDPDRLYLMGHSAGAAHVAQYVAHSRFGADGPGGIAGAILVSGLFDPAITGPEDYGVPAYFGHDPQAWAARSAVPGLARSRVPLLVVEAELDPPEFLRQAQRLQAARCAAGHCAPVYRLSGHDHLSEIFALHTPDTALSDAIRRFVGT